MLSQRIDVDIDPQEIAENQPNDTILEFILELDEALENEDFTIELVLKLLQSSDCPDSIIDQIKKHYGIEGMD